jgi:hypothetical protein
MGSRIRNQRHRDDLAIVRDGGWTASPPRAVLLFERLIGVTNQHEPEGEDVYPARVSDTIGRASYCGISFRGAATRRVP